MQKKTKKTQDISKLLKDQTEKLVEIFDDRIKTVQEEFNGINKKLDSHKEQIGDMWVDLTEIKHDLKQIKLDIKINLDTKLDKKHFVDLDQRVRRLEKK